MPDELTDGARFGRALAISGDTILVGSPYKTVNGALFRAQPIYLTATWVAVINGARLRRWSRPTAPTMIILAGR
jgi:hypothetical protein